MHDGQELKLQFTVDLTVADLEALSAAFPPEALSGWEAGMLDWSPERAVVSRLVHSVHDALADIPGISYGAGAVQVQEAGAALTARR